MIKISEHFIHKNKKVIEFWPLFHDFRTLCCDRQTTTTTFIRQNHNFKLILDISIVLHITLTQCGSIVDEIIEGWHFL